MYYIRETDDGHGDARTERRLGVLPTTLLPTPIIPPFPPFHYLSFTLTPVESIFMIQSVRSTCYMALQFTKLNCFRVIFCLQRMIDT